MFTPDLFPARGEFVTTYFDTFQAYDDVLQCFRNGEWLDFCTIKTVDDAGYAERLVRSGQWEGKPLAFRVQRNRREIVLERGLPMGFGRPDIAKRARHD